MRKRQSLHGTIQPVVLAIIDGFGVGKKNHNPFFAARPEHLTYYFEHNPTVFLDPTGAAVGLPDHHLGDSAVGHMTIGTGRVIEQDLVRINKAIASRAFDANSVLLDAMTNAAQPGRALHLLGLVSDAGIHSHIDHLYALLEMAKRSNCRHVFVHVITDGRDVKDKTAKHYLTHLTSKMHRLGIGEVATLAGRHYAMDRTSNWQREQKVYDALVHGRAPAFVDWQTALQKATTDASLEPCLVTTKDHRTPRVIDGDSVIFFNFRHDRARQLTHGFTDFHFSRFRRKRLALHFVAFTDYDNLNIPVAFPRPILQNTLADVLSRAHIHHLHCAETEKFLHITQSFTTRNTPKRYGHWKELPTKPLPNMNAVGITKTAINAMRSHYGAIILNYANLDILGHHGDITLAKKGMTFLDHQISHLVAEAGLRGYTVLLVADHGNIEDLSPDRKNLHTRNKVPFTLIDHYNKYNLYQPTHGSLCDVAPTMLGVMGLPIPREMEGRNLLKAAQ